MTSERIFLASLKKRGRVETVFVDDEDYALRELADLECVEIADGIIFRLKGDPLHEVEVVPIIEVEDDHVAHARLKFRVCKAVPQ